MITSATRNTCHSNHWCYLLIENRSSSDVSHVIWDRETSESALLHLLVPETEAKEEPDEF